MGTSSNLFMCPYARLHILPGLSDARQPHLILFPYRFPHHRTPQRRGEDWHDTTIPVNCNPTPNKCSLSSSDTYQCQETKSKPSTKISAEEIIEKNGIGCSGTASPLVSQLGSGNLLQQKGLPDFAWMPSTALQAGSRNSCQLCLVTSKDKACGKPVNISTELSGHPSEA